jgi:hypothetical protein
LRGDWLVRAAARGDDHDWPANVWWIDLKPNESFSYNLRRMGTDRFFSIKFDLKKEIPAPTAPWGWKD